MLSNLGPQLRYTLRVLRKSPGFTAVAVLSLALGIGANTAIFSLLNALLLRDLPVREPGRLVELSVLRRGDKIPFSYPMFRELITRQRAFSGLIGWSFGQISNLELNGAFSQAEVRSVTGNYYSELGAEPLLGRLIMPNDVKDGAAPSPVAVLSYDFWQRRFGASPDAVGRTLAIEGQPFTIIGVTRRWFTGIAAGEPADIMVPMKSNEDRSRLWIFITGRLKDGVGLGEARAELQSEWPEVLLRTSPTETPGLRRQAFLGMTVDISPAATGVNKALRERFSRPLYVLMGIVALILLVACVNLANLMLARSALRSREVGVRVALGASRWAVASEVMTECLVLSGSGALLGLAFAYWGSRLLIGLMTEGSLTSVILDVRPDGSVLLLTASAAVLTGMLFGLVPAWRSSREAPAAALGQSGRGFASGTSAWGKGLMIAQVALSLVLLLGAGLLTRSFEKLRAMDPRLEEGVLGVDLVPKPGGFENLDVANYHRQLVSQISNIPGVSTAAFSDASVLTKGGWLDTVSPASQSATENSGVMSMAAMISPDFFRTLGIALVRGRNFEWSDDAEHPRVAIISSALEGRLFADGNAIGRHVRFGFMPEVQDLEVVGVASDARLFDLHDARAPVIYLPFYQNSKWAESGDLYVRAALPPEAMARTVEREIESLGHEYAASIKTVAQEVSQSLVEERVIATLSGCFAALALLLASVGLYGLISYGVTRRTREMGIRAALGTRRSTVVWLVLREALALVLVGIFIGIPCALAAARLIRGMLFGISTDDLPTLAAVSLLLIGVAVAAAYLPASRASRIEAVEALRSE